MKADAKYWRVYAAVRDMTHQAERARDPTREFSIKKITRWIESKYTDPVTSDVAADVCKLTVNDRNRPIHSGKRGFRSDGDHPHDLLHRRKDERGRVFISLYDMNQHGVYDLQKDSAGKYQVVHVQPGPMATALVEARAQVAASQPPIDTDHDARIWEMRAVAMRRGQPAFRAALIEAYEGRCAITGCNVLDILEAAHIVPFRGAHTHRTDNGLLLRADIHTLFDLGHLTIDADNLTAIVAPRIRESEYGALHGRPIALPKDAGDRPNREHLLEHCRLATQA